MCLDSICLVISFLYFDDFPHTMHSHIVPSFLIMAAISKSNSSRLLIETEDKKFKCQVEPRCSASTCLFISSYYLTYLHLTCY